MNMFGHRGCVLAVFYWHTTAFLLCGLPLQDTSTTMTNTDTPCPNQLDVAFAIDASYSVAPHFQNILELVKDFSLRVPLSENSFRISVTQFSTDARVELSLLNGSSVDGVQRAMDSVEYHAGSTQTGKAFRAIREKVFTQQQGDRGDVPDLVLLITDGPASDHDSFISESLSLKASVDATVFAVSLGFLTDPQELKAVAGDNVFSTSQLEDVAALSQSLVARICQEFEPARHPITHPTTDKINRAHQPVPDTTIPSASTTFPYASETSLSPDGSSRFRGDGQSTVPMENPTPTLSHTNTPTKSLNVTQGMKSLTRNSTNVAKIGHLPTDEGHNPKRHDNVTSINNLTSNSINATQIGHTPTHEGHTPKRHNNMTSINSTSFPSVTSCGDRLDNCTGLTQADCQGNETWAVANCALTCGYCWTNGSLEVSGESKCEDAIPNCSDYGRYVCSHPSYTDWTREHCSKYCQLCDSGRDHNNSKPASGINAPNIANSTSDQHETNSLSACVDLLPDCDNYGGVSVCSDYAAWASVRCRRYCGFCTESDPSQRPIEGPHLTCPQWALPADCSLKVVHWSQCPMPSCPDGYVLTAVPQQG